MNAQLSNLAEEVTAILEGRPQEADEAVVRYGIQCAGVDPAFLGMYQTMLYGLRGVRIPHEPEDEAVFGYLRTHGVRDAPWAEICKVAVNPLCLVQLASALRIGVLGQPDTPIHETWAEAEGQLLDDLGLGKVSRQPESQPA